MFRPFPTRPPLAALAVTKLCAHLQPPATRFLRSEIISVAENHLQFQHTTDKKRHHYM